MLIAWAFVTLGFCNYEEAMDVWLEGSVCGVEGGSKELSWLKKEKIGTIVKPWALGLLFVSRSCTGKQDMGGGGDAPPPCMASTQVQNCKVQPADIQQTKDRGCTRHR